MNIDLYTICYNESAIIPFMVDYWKALKLRHVYVYDNFSTDNSRDLLGRYPGWIDIIDYKTDGGLDDDANMKLKNTVWKGSDADFVIVCDFDEIVWCEDWDDEVRKMKDRGITIVKPLQVHPYMEAFPEYTEGKLLHELNGVRFCDTRKDAKKLMFSPKDLTAINYTPGAHQARPWGNIRESSCNIYMFHMNYIGREYFVDKFHKRKEQLSPTNRRKRYGFQYFFEDKKILEMLDDAYKNSSETLPPLRRN